VSRLTGVVYLEAFHYPYHPFFQRVREIIEAGGVGVIRHIDAPLWMPAPPDDDPRWSLELAGGAMMDLGCNSISCLRLLGEFAGGEPTVVAATAEERPGQPGVDERLTLDVAYPDGAPARVAPTWPTPEVPSGCWSPGRPARSSARCSRCRTRTTP
jgi:predicted dehydrogenase